MYVMLNWSESLERLTMKRCSDPKRELFFYTVGTIKISSVSEMK